MTHPLTPTPPHAAAATRAPDLTLQMVSDPVYLSGAREMVSAVSRRLGFSEEACGQIALAVDEALCNVIRHGYDKRRDGPIWLSVWPEYGDNGQSGVKGIRIVVEDEARQVDPSQIKSRNLDEIRPGGLGVHIIREVMDEVTFEKRDRVGMRLTLVKHKKKDGGCCSAGGA
ncbi:MAG: ATP-binding protein [Phycisphaeraceae bacterium]|nr:ATP-binding protein [Phycisphaeraceae bacterium]